MNCETCLKPNANLACEICTQKVCKKCAQILPEDAFSFLKIIPMDLRHSIYCPRCYESIVTPAFDSYNETLALAKNVDIFFKTQGKETRGYKRKEAPLHVTDCSDYDEALLRLAFLAVKAQFNTLIDVEMNSKKVIINGYQSTIWSSTGIPVKGK